MPINLDSFISQLAARPSVCESCGAEFACGATLAGCWCNEIKLSDETRAELRTRFSSCLCRACLERLAEGEQREQGHER
jgi:cysteine-rich CWC protein